MNRTKAYYGGDVEIEDRRFSKFYSSIMPVEIVLDADSNYEGKIITYIGGDAYSAPIAHIKKGTGLNEYHYLHRDYLGSVMAITNANSVVEQRHFNAWGKVEHFKGSQNNTTFNHSSLIGRGYTGHEHFFEVGLLHMNGRMYDPHLGRFLSPDNYVQDPYNTQNFNRYGYGLNNPLKYSDPSGEVIVPVLVGAAIGIISNGINNTINGQGFFEGAMAAGFYGAVGGAASAGIGGMVSGLPESMSSLTVGSIQAGAHAISGGAISFAQGGNFWSGALAGGISSGMSAVVGSSLNGASNFWKGAGMIGSGAVSGGIGSVIGGGDFWDGFRQGVITSGLNHVAHLIQKRITYGNILKDAGYKPNRKASPTMDYVCDMLQRVKVAGEWYEKGGMPEIFVEENSKDYPYYHSGGHFINLTKPAFSSNWNLLSTILHESYHAYQYTAKVMGGKTISHWVQENIGSTLMEGYKGWYFLEMQAYNFEISMGNTDSRVSGLF